MTLVVVSFPPHFSLCVGDIKRVHQKRMGTGSIYFIVKHPKQLHTHMTFVER
ncbi:hypothetical protein CFP56_020590 [Quercus suber]|uniref:Uncharacterized protein n=1 Tax=Quercus suber TaxID=58331 RepID=A0AAW0KGD3_QUESU